MNFKKVSWVKNRNLVEVLKSASNYVFRHHYKDGGARRQNGAFARFLRRELPEQFGVSFPNPYSVYSVYICNPYCSFINNLHAHVCTICLKGSFCGMKSFDKKMGCLHNIFTLRLIISKQIWNSFQFYIFVLNLFNLLLVKCPSFTQQQIGLVLSI